eukprot:scaffold628733_cov41-Prasinocladus_malaysianus.AAC.1
MFGECVVFRIQDGRLSSERWSDGGGAAASRALLSRGGERIRDGLWAHRVGPGQRLHQQGDIRLGSEDGGARDGAQGPRRQCEGAGGQRGIAAALRCIGRQGQAVGPRPAEMFPGGFFLN